MLVGQQTRKHRDIDINFDSKETERLLDILDGEGYQVVEDWLPVRVELYHPELGYIDIHPFDISDEKKIRQADLEGGWYEFEPDYFGRAEFSGRTIPCISAKGQLVFHTGYELREIDKRDIENIKKVLEYQKKPLDL